MHATFHGQHVQPIIWSKLWTRITKWNSKNKSKDEEYINIFSKTKSWYWQKKLGIEINNNNMDKNIHK